MKILEDFSQHIIELFIQETSIEDFKRLKENIKNE